MFCPQCGQQQVSDETRFCSRCGFTLVGVVDLIARGGALPEHMLSADQLSSPRKKGIKQGLFIFLLGFLIVPLLMIFAITARLGPALPLIGAVLLGVGGLLRMVYAMMFESANPGGATLEQNVLAAAQNVLRKPEANALPPHQSIPVSDYVSPASGNWRDTNELATPGPVTENTTRLLEKDQ